MENPTCKTCPYFKTPNGKGGFCRRYPPVTPQTEAAVEHAEDPLDGSWPFIDESDWCGEHPDFPAYIASLKATAPTSC